ncbi:type IV pilus biogenesis protein PilM [Paenibacillus thalictri]|nr:pilus assembly protein PilM [Paenibacillus thalictri]
MPDRYSIGIEITDHAVKTVEMELKSRRNPHILCYGSESLPLNCVDDGKIIEPYKVIQSIQTLFARLNIKSKRVHLVVPSQSIMVRFLKLPDIPLKDLRKLIDFEVKHNIHLPFENPVYDFVKLNGSERPAKKSSKPPKKDSGAASLAEPDLLGLREAASTSNFGLDLKGINLFGEDTSAPEETPEAVQCDVMLVAGPKELIEQYLEIIRSAGLKPISMEFKALSLYRLMEKTEFADPKATCLVVDINENVTDISIFHDCLLKITRTVPIHFKKPADPQQTSDTPIPPEEEVSLFSLFQSNDKESEFTASCSDLAHELERLMNFYRYTLNNRNQEFSRIVLSGDVVRLHDIEVYLRERLNMEVTVAYSPGIKTDDGLLEHAFPAMAVPIGLALRGRET